MRGVFVTGTDTGVGKTIVAACVCAALAARGERVAAFKPAVTGLDEDPHGWAHDHELLAEAASAGQSAEQLAPYRFGPALSPHLAAELAGRAIDPPALVEAARSAGDAADALICEGVGGLMVPLTAGYLVRDLAVELELPVVVAAHSGLGTINHTLLTVEAARAVGLPVAGVVMTPWPADPGALERSNRDTVAALGRVPVGGLPPIAAESRAGAAEELAEAAAALPVGDWLAARKN